MTIWMPISGISLGDAKRPPDDCRCGLRLHVTHQHPVDQADQLPPSMTWLHPAARQGKS